MCVLGLLMDLDMEYYLSCLSLSFMLLDDIESLARVSHLGISTLSARLSHSL